MQLDAHCAGSQEPKHWTKGFSERCERWLHTLSSWVHDSDPPWDAVITEEKQGWIPDLYYEISQEWHEGEMGTFQLRKSLDVPGTWGGSARSVLWWGHGVLVRGHSPVPGASPSLIPPFPNLLDKWKFQNGVSCLAEMTWPKVRDCSLMWLWHRRWGQEWKSTGYVESILFLKKNYLLLKSSWITMLCQLLLYNKVTQLYVYIHTYIYIYILIHIYIHTYLLFHILFHYGLSQNIEYSSLCYQVGSRCLLVAQLCLTLWIPWMVAHQVPMSMEFSRQEYWSGLLFPHPEMEPRSPALQADSLLSETPGKPSLFYIYQFASASLKLGEGNGTPLQYSCLENPMEGGAWWAAVHGVTKSRTQLSNFTFPFHFHALEKAMATHSSVLAWRIPGTAEPGGLPPMGWHGVGHDWSDSAAAAAASRPHSHPLPQSSPWQPQVRCLPVSLFLFCRCVRLCHILDSTCKW